MELLPVRLRSTKSPMPKVRGRSSQSRIAAVLDRHARRRCVGLILGCVQRVLFGDVNAATARVLARGLRGGHPARTGLLRRAEVHAGQRGGARGAPAGRSRHSSGPRRHGRDQRRRLWIDPEGVRPSAARRSESGPGARGVLREVRDISEILAELEPRATYHPLPYRVAYHDACHLQHAQGVSLNRGRCWDESRSRHPGDRRVGDLLRQRGIYNLIEPETARELGERKAQNCRRREPTR